ncbi:MAG: FAD:protein FMN transferase [Acidimicrobiia bacterium]
MDSIDHRFRAMGTSCHVVITDGDPMFAEALEAAVLRLEARWSRFVTTSELHRINNAAGAPVVLPEDTFGLIALAVAAWYRTGGLFDPTILDALVGCGYDRSFELLPTERDAIDRELVDRDSRRSIGCAGFDLDPVLSAVRLPVGVRIDLGGLGKGYAADLVGARTIAQGVPGSMVNLGGDVWCHGTAPCPDGWQISIEDPFRPGSGSEMARVSIAEGAVATSSALRRRWPHGSVTAHHLIDPRTGRPADSGVVSATVIAGSAGWAEVFAKAVVVGGRDAGARLLAANGVTGLCVDDRGEVHLFDGFESFGALRSDRRLTP